MYNEMQWVYGTVAHELRECETDAAIAAPGERVLLVYPMRTDDATGRVDMRVKTAHPVTGQLQMRWTRTTPTRAT